MTISAKMICHSKNEYGQELKTFQLRYPRFIHAEFMTHRMFSRNASSSRAIPVSKLIEDIERDPVYPSFWGKNQPGMQAATECNNRVIIPHVYPRGYYDGTVDWESDVTTRGDAWDQAREQAIKFARAFDEAGYHKQIVNRLLEPFSHINVVVTATDYENFYALRRHPDAQPEIKLLADAMWEAEQNSIPKSLTGNEWHLPYITENEPWELFTTKLIKISVARCARVSYLTHEGKEPDIASDLKLYERLVGSTPLHASPAEHQATPDRIICNNPLTWKHPELHGNFHGFIQYRKTLPNENVKG